MAKCLQKAFDISITITTANYITICLYFEICKHTSNSMIIKGLVQVGRLQCQDKRNKCSVLKHCFFVQSLLSFHCFLFLRRAALLWKSWAIFGPLCYLLLSTVGVVVGRKKRVVEWMSMDAFGKCNTAHQILKFQLLLLFCAAELDRHSIKDLAKSANPCPCQIHENSHPSAAPSPKDGMHVYRATVDTGRVKALAVRVQSFTASHYPGALSSGILFKLQAYLEIGTAAVATEADSKPSSLFPASLYCTLDTPSPTIQSPLSDTVLCVWYIIPFRAPIIAFLTKRRYLSQNISLIFTFQLSPLSSRLCV